MELAVLNEATKTEPVSYWTQAEKAMRILGDAVKIDGVTPDTVIKLSQDVAEKPLVQFKTTNDKGEQLDAQQIIFQWREDAQADTRDVDQARAAAVAEVAIKGLNSDVEEIKDKYGPSAEPHSEDDNFLRQVYKIALPNITLSQQLASQVSLQR